MYQNLLNWLIHAILETFISESGNFFYFSIRNVGNIQPRNLQEMVSTYLTHHLNKLHGSLIVHSSVLEGFSTHKSCSHCIMEISEIYKAYLDPCHDEQVYVLHFYPVNLQHSSCKHVFWESRQFTDKTVHRHTF